MSVQLGYVAGRMRWQVLNGMTCSRRVIYGVRLQNFTSFLPHACSSMRIMDAHRDVALYVKIKAVGSPLTQGFCCVARLSVQQHLHQGKIHRPLRGIYEGSGGGRLGSYGGAVRMPVHMPTLP